MGGVLDLMGCLIRPSRLIAMVIDSGALHIPVFQMA